MKKDRLLTRYTMLLIPAGILINIIFSNIVLHFELPIFLDSIGTILAAVLGGYLPGIFVGFFSNVINSVNDSVTLYYGIISILIAVCAAWLSRRRFFNNPVKALLSSLLFSVIGGGLGSIITWLLYGFNFGTGISAPFSIWLNRDFGISKFFAQFIADMGIDIIDKILTVAFVFVLLLLLPDAFIKRFPDGRLLTRNGAEYMLAFQKEKKLDNRKSLRTKVVLIIVLATAVLGVLATTISFTIYKDTMTQKYLHTNAGVVDLMLSDIDADSVERYLQTGVEDEGYRQTEARLDEIRKSFNEIEYMYVYQIRQDGCYVVFDIDTPELKGEALGTHIDFDPTFLPYVDALLVGEEIEPIISDDRYGWLLTIYKPIFNSRGECVAYAAADISMDSLVSDRSTFIIKMASLQFGVAMIIAAFAVWFAERRVVYPINAMTEAANDFAYNDKDGQLIRSDKILSLKIKTGDELEDLYDALVKTAKDVERYVLDIRKQSDLIFKMQSNIIISFANMVENRDLNTGEHIKHTAGYVRIIAEELKKQGVYNEILTDKYIENIVNSAPLHDIGKIKIPDTILNKPGKLTPDEFEQMKTHAAAGRDILIDVMSGIENDDYLKNAIDMAQCHHEKWNGKGYPDALSGQSIPLSARIMSVADVFDALISKRSYKEAYSFDEAYEIILSEAGISFDPEVVAAFERARSEIKRVSGK